MTDRGLLQIGIFLILITACVKPLGLHIVRSVEGDGKLARAFAPVENFFYRFAGVDPAQEQNWIDYTFALLAFNLAGIIVLYALQRLQAVLPLNPQHFSAVSPDLALNTAISFASNTSWQSYGGETTLGNLVQMAGITVQSFASAATGIAVGIAFIRGLERRTASTIGNFWVDITRISLYVLLPICVVATIFFVWQGVPQTLESFISASPLDGGSQILAIGPVASQEAIKLLSGDGGGFFNVNSAHPFENPTALAGLVEMLLIFFIGAALTYSFGRMVRDQRQGWVLYAAMAVLFITGLAVVYGAEKPGNPLFASIGIDQAPSPLQGGGNMEGKEVRFGAAQSSLFAEVSTASSDGAVDSMHDSFMPLSGLVLMANMMVDEVIVGGPGSGLFSILLFAIVAVFVAGLMIGRTPEYLGKKIGANEVKMTMLALLCPPAFILILPAVASVVSAGLAGLNNAGPHGFSEILYAYTSGAATNGSSFAGLNANSAFYNLTLAGAMFAGRYLVLVPVLCIAGSLVEKRIVPASAGTLPTHGIQFVGLLVSTIVIVGGLTFFPALAIGPIAEHFMMVARHVY